MAMRRAVRERGTRNGLQKQKGQYFSEGSRQLWLRILAGTSGRDLERQIDIAHGTIWRYLYGTGWPDLDTAYKIFDELGIEPRLFLMKPKARFTIPDAVALRSERVVASRTNRAA